MSVRLILDQLLTEKGMTRYELAKKTKIRYQIVDNYYKNKVIRYDSYVLDKFCTCLNCDIADLIVYTKD